MFFQLTLRRQVGRTLACTLDFWLACALDFCLACALAMLTCYAEEIVYAGLVADFIPNVFQFWFSCCYWAFAYWAMRLRAACNPTFPSPPNPKTLQCGMSLVKCWCPWPSHLEDYLTLTLPFPTQPQDPTVWNVACKMLMPMAFSSWSLPDPNPSLPHPTPRPYSVEFRW